MIDKLGSLHFSPDSILQLWISSFVEADTREQIVNQGQEQRFVLVHQLGEVHVSQHSHHNCLLCIVGRRSFCGTEGTQDGQDVTQTKVIVHL